MMNKMTECARSAVMLGGEISQHFDILREVAQGCTLSPNLFKVPDSYTVVVRGVADLYP